MADNENFEKVLTFLQEVVIFGGNGSKPLEHYANQALVIMTIGELKTKIATLESIMHLLNKKQCHDVTQMIRTYEGMINKLHAKF